MPLRAAARQPSAGTLPAARTARIQLFPTIAAGIDTAKSAGGAAARTWMEERQAELPGGALLPRRIHPTRPNWRFPPPTISEECRHPWVLAVRPSRETRNEAGMRIAIRLDPSSALAP